MKILRNNAQLRPRTRPPAHRLPAEGARRWDAATRKPSGTLHTEPMGQSRAMHWVPTTFQHAPCGGPVPARSTRGIPDTIFQAHYASALGVGWHSWRASRAASRAASCPLLCTIQHMLEHHLQSARMQGPAGCLGAGSSRGDGNAVGAPKERRRPPYHPMEHGPRRLPLPMYPAHREDAANASGAKHRGGANVYPKFPPHTLTLVRKGDVELAINLVPPQYAVDVVLKRARAHGVLQCPCRSCQHARASSAAAKQEGG